MMTTFPELCLQRSVGQWWERDAGTTLERGRLLRSFVPHVDAHPQTLHPIGRADGTQHGGATFELKATHIRRDRRAPNIPVAALPQLAGEIYSVHRAKVRPLLVLFTDFTQIPSRLRSGTPSWQTSPTVLAAPYYGADADGTRAGWRADFLLRIKACEYPQYLWDMLPLPGSSESILRLDHIQPIGRSLECYELTPHRLHGDALAILADWIDWIARGALHADTMLADIRATLMKELKVI